MFPKIETLLTFSDDSELTRCLNKDAYCICLDNTALTDEAVFQHFVDRGRHYESWKALWDIGARIDIKRTEPPPFAEAFHALPFPKDDKWLAFAVAAMLAEEYKVLPNGEPSKTGCMIKIVGFHQVLVEGWKPAMAASWSVGKRCHDIYAYADRIEEMQW